MLKQITTKELEECKKSLMMNSKQYSQQDLRSRDLLKESIFEIKKTESCTEISVYPKQKCSTEFFTKQALRIRSAFPDLDNNFFSLLQEMVFDLEISEKKLYDSVMNVIKTHIWDRPPRIASFLNYDEKIKFYDYQQILKLNDEYAGKVFNYYSKVELSFTSQILYAKNTDIDKYKLKKAKQNEQNTI